MLSELFLHCLSDTNQSFIFIYCLNLRTKQSVRKKVKMALFPPMTRQSAVHVMAGTFIMISIGLGYFVHPGCFIIAGFVGVNLFQYGFTHQCPAEIVFGLMGLPDATCPIKLAMNVAEKQVTPAKINNVESDADQESKV